MSDFRDNAKGTGKEVDSATAALADRYMSEVRAKLLLKQPFYGVLLSMTDFIPESVIPTMATDGIKVYYNPEFVVKLSEAERNGVLLHEISHCIYLHCNPARRLNRDRMRWNYAADYAINLEIRDLGYTLPKEVLLDEKYRNMNAEMIYDKLPKEEDALKALGGTLDTHIEPADGTEDWDDMEDKIISAFEMTKDYYDNSKNHGKFPGGIKRWIEKMRKSKVKWERIFHRYIGQALAKDDFSYERFNRRLLPQDIFLPDMRNHIIGSVVLGIDTSGSITPKILEQFAAELAKISHLTNEVTVMTCDAKVHEVVKIRKMENFLKKIKFKGGCGTDFRPVFKEVEDRKIAPELLIYLTDAWGSFPQKRPQYPVIWCLTTGSNSKGIPWGQKVEMPPDNPGGY
jgi:predicted metal-dependent peptidase